MRKGKYFNCEVCNINFYRRPSQAIRGNVKFCSKKCQGFSYRGRNISEEQKGKLRECKRNEEQRRKYSLSKLRDKNPQWKGGIISTKHDYIIVRTYGRKSRYRPQHRIVVEQHMGRYLKPEEVVHHINKVRTDNRIQNLMVINSNSQHSLLHNNPSKFDPKSIVFDGSKL